MSDLKIAFAAFYEKISGKPPLTWGDALKAAGMPPDPTIADEYFAKHAVDCFEAFKAGYAASVRH